MVLGLDSRSRLGIGILLTFLVLALTSHPAEAKRRKKSRRSSPPIAALTRDGWPNVQAKGAIVLDLDDGRELYVKSPDDARAIASTGKIFVAMVVREKGIDLEAATEILDDDQKLARGGAKSRLLVGRSFKNRDLLAAMLIGSDNRACTAVARAVGLTPDQLITEMNVLARRMGLARTRFTSPSGLRGNESTPREMALALIRSMEDPVLAEIMRTGQLEIRATDSGGPTRSGKGKKSSYGVIYNNTNVSLRTSQYTVIGGKTGYTDLARYCLVIGAKIAGKRYAMVFLGAEGELTRFADFQRVANWISERGHEGKKVAGTGVGKLADSPPGAVTPRLAR